MNCFTRCRPFILLSGIFGFPRLDSSLLCEPLRQLNISLFSLFFLVAQQSRGELWDRLYPMTMAEMSKMPMIQGYFIETQFCLPRLSLRTASSGQTQWCRRSLSPSLKKTHKPNSNLLCVIWLPSHPLGWPWM